MLNSFPQHSSPFSPFCSVSSVFSCSINKKEAQEFIFLRVPFWRSGRDSNPRTAFDRHTISSRARYDRFDTTPWHHRFCHFRNSSIILHDQAVNVKSFPNYFCMASTQAFRTCPAMGAATALPAPAFSTNTTNASGWLSSLIKPANVACAGFPACSAVPDFAQT